MRGQKKNADNFVYYPELPAVEIFIYLIMWIAGTGWLLFSLYPVSRENEEKYFSKGLVEQGWKDYLGMYKDVTDDEWVLWNKFYVTTVAVGYSGHFIVARVADKFFPKERFKIHALYTLLFVTNFMGITGICFLFVHFAVQYCVAITTKSIALCWVTALGLIYSLTDDTCISLVTSFYKDEDKGMGLIFTTAVCLLRSHSFNIEYIWSLRDKGDQQDKSEKQTTNKVARKNIGVRQRKNDDLASKASNTGNTETKDDNPSFTFADLIIYQLYFPLFFGGPVMTYNQMAHQAKRPPVIWTGQMIRSFIFGMLRFTFWHLCMDVFMHLFYLGALFEDANVLKTGSLTVLCGNTLFLGYAFNWKYKIMYGLSSHFSSSDNLEPPKGPHCVGGKHRVTDMWKYFDRGLHKWLVRYIYIPCIGDSETAAIPNIILGSILSFGFTCYWHGPTVALMGWITLCWIAVFLEMLGLKFYKTAQVQYIDKVYLSPQWSRRLRGVFSAPFYGLMISTGIYYLNEMFVSTFVMKRLYAEDLMFTTLVHVGLYAGVQVSMEFHRRGIGKPE